MVYARSLAVNGPPPRPVRLSCFDVPRRWVLNLSRSSDLNGTLHGACLLRARRDRKVQNDVGTGSLYAPAIIISAILIVGDTTAERQRRSLPIISIDMNISLRLPAIVISCTG